MAPISATTRSMELSRSGSSTVMPNRLRFPSKTPISNSPRTGGCPSRPSSSPPSFAATMISAKDQYRLTHQFADIGRRRQMAVSPRSPLRMRTTSSMRGDEDFSVADLAGARRGGKRFDHLTHVRRGHDHLQLHLRKQVHLIFRAAVNLGVAFLAAVAADFGDRHAADADRRSGLLSLRPACGAE